MSVCFTTAVIQLRRPQRGLGGEAAGCEVDEWPFFCLNPPGAGGNTHAGLLGPLLLLMSGLEAMVRRCGIGILESRLRDR